MARPWFDMWLTLASTVAKLKRCQQTPMPIPWDDHRDLTRCAAAIGEDDLREATTAMGRCLFHLQRDLLLDAWRVRTGRTAHSTATLTDLRTATGRSVAKTRKIGRFTSSQ